LVKEYKIIKILKNDIVIIDDENHNHNFSKTDYFNPKGYERFFHTQLKMRKDKIKKLNYYNESRR